jgi:hypothetical protein
MHYVFVLQRRQFLVFINCCVQLIFFVNADPNMSTCN